MAEPVAPAQTTVPEPPIFEPYKPCCNPCPCIPLDRGATSIARFEIILHSIALIWIIISTTIYFVVEIVKKQSHYDVILVVYASIFSFVSVVNLILGIFLYFGVKHCSQWKCCVYFIGRLISQIILIFMLIVYALEEAKMKPLTSKEYSNIALIIIICIIFVIICIGMYILLVVYFFIEQLKFYSTQPVYKVPNQLPQPQVVRPLSYDANLGTAPSWGGL